MDKQLELIAKRLAELGHPTRLGIFRLLVQSGPAGLPVGDIQQQLAIPGSTLSHHLARLMQADLVTQERDKNSLYCKPQFNAVQETLEFLLKECCQGSCSLADAVSGNETACCN
ncbi:MAG: ArsR/SmtB family transcription factor [Pseudomonadota bacterium]